MVVSLTSRNLSDATGNGQITGGIPAQWMGISDAFAPYVNEKANNQTGPNYPTM